MGGHLGKCVSGDFRDATELPSMYTGVRHREQIMDGPTAAVAEHERPGHLCRGSTCIDLYGNRAKDKWKAADYTGCAEDAARALRLLEGFEKWLASNSDLLRKVPAEESGKAKLTKQRSRDDSTLPSLQQPDKPQSGCTAVCQMILPHSQSCLGRLSLL